MASILAADGRSRAMGLPRTIGEFPEAARLKGMSFALHQFGVPAAHTASEAGTRPDLSRFTLMLSQAHALSAFPDEKDPALYTVTLVAGPGARVLAGLPCQFALKFTLRADRIAAVALGQLASGHPTGDRTLRSRRQWWGCRRRGGDVRRGCAGER